MRFKGVFIVAVLPTGQAGPVNASFRQRFSVSATPQSVSLLISKVTTVDDKLNGEFSCELNDLPGATWRRAIQVQVVGKLKSFADFLEILTINNGKISAQPHTTLCIQFLDRENNDKNNTLPLGKQICLTIVWGCAEILPTRIILHAKF